MFLYNSSCLDLCPINSYSSTMTKSDNATIDICVDCLPQCKTCSGNTSCSSCSSLTEYKYEFTNLTTNLTDCLKACPI